MRYSVVQIVLKEKILGAASRGVPELEHVLNEHAAKGWRLHTISTAHGASRGYTDRDRIQDNSSTRSLSSTASLNSNLSKSFDVYSLILMVTGARCQPAMAWTGRSLRPSCQLFMSSATSKRVT